MDAAERKYIKMTTAPVKGLVCSFALPSIICMLTTSIYNMADICAFLLCIPLFVKAYRELK